MYSRLIHRILYILPEENLLMLSGGREERRGLSSHYFMRYFSLYFHHFTQPTYATFFHFIMVPQAIRLTCHQVINDTQFTTNDKNKRLLFRNEFTNSGTNNKQQTRNPLSKRLLYVVVLKVLHVIPVRAHRPFTGR